MSAAPAAVPPVPPSLRLFLALWPGAGGRGCVAAWQAQQDWGAAARPVLPVHLHLTLHFIGAVPAHRLAEVADGLAEPCGRIELVLDRLDFWRGGIAVLRPGHVPAALTALHARLAVPLQRLGLPVEMRPYRPHVTLARRAAPAAPAAPRPVPPLRWRCEGYALVASAGGRYTVLRRYRGRAAAPAPILRACTRGSAT